ncbi:transglycosylase domain-containing protein [Aquabacterium sp. OR-4]|uniref:transglycosylase domain-containing protein n=1 Tax=Aquabacterium sp. OR-4 TaxID=2978127 RepID=UPI0028C5408C|nr:transglycosylase domain-containing protein [Aquabacterium sp. OR-4]MDT7835058.1 transglycosylase domain-containing protein [Aquabacterium sp. OR-4]
MPNRPEPSADAAAGAAFVPLPERRWRRSLRGMLWAALALLGLAVAAGGALLAAVWWGTPSAAAIAQRLAAEPSQIVSSDGVLLQRLDSRVHEPVTPQQVPAALIDALLATEDRRFYSHGGVDPRRVLGSVLATLRGDLQGGSTLTQQLARNLFPDEVGQQRSLMRKLRELAVALKLEGLYDKPALLALYLNQVPYRYNVVGVGAAARTYFGKPAAALATHEAALLVALLKGPAQYDPERFPARALARRNLVLARMQATGRLDAGQARQARAQALGLALQRADLAAPPAPHYLRVVRQQLGDWARSQGLDPQRDGLRVQVSLDTRQQALAEQAVARQTALLQRVAEAEWSRAELRAGPPAAATVATPFAHFWRERGELLAELAQATPAYRRARAAGADEAAALALALRDPQLAALQADRTRLEAGFIALDPRSGAVRAHVGSRNFAHDRFDHVTQARRQPGSTFKPFVYGAALRDGMAPVRRFVDEVLHYPLASGGRWSPADAGGASGQAMSLRSGLARSRNTITAQVMHEVGPVRVAHYARLLGVDRSPLQAVPSLALGTSPVTLLEMAQAYGTLAALGQRRTPVFIERITDRHGLTLFVADGRAEQVLDTGHAALLVDMLRDAVDQGTGRALRTQFGVRGDVVGKTGTTQRNTDGWFIAAHPRLVVGAWVGFNDPRVTMRSTEWGQGGRSALRLAGDFLAALQAAGQLPEDARFPAVPREPEPAGPAIAIAIAPEALDGALDGAPDEASPAAQPPPHAGEPADHATLADTGLATVAGVRFSPVGQRPGRERPAP